MCKTMLDEFKKEMAPAEKIFREELQKFAENYDFLGEMTLTEQPDIDTQEYIYTFKKLNGTSRKVLHKTLNEIYDHMAEFSKSNDISEFSRKTIILFEGDFDRY